MKKYLKRLLKKIGLVVLKTKNYQKIIDNNFNEKNLAHTIHLDFLMKLLYDLNYQPKSIFDVGANKGGWTASTLEYFPNANYVLFEPQQNLANDINNRFLNKPNVQCFAVGVGNEKATLQFTIHDRDDSCNFRMTKEEAQAKGFQQMEVPVIAIDEFINEQNLPKPDILKIDAEGIDLQVLEGAQETIKNHTEVVLIEVAVMNPSFDNSALKVMNQMDALGFKLFDITDLNRPLTKKILWLSEFVFVRKNGILDKVYHS